MKKIIGINRADNNSILSKFLEEEKNNANYLPSYFERDFLINELLIINENETLENYPIKIQGKIDRIDIDKTNKSFRVLDYKTSSNLPKMQDIYSGISLQLPVYLYAVSKILLDGYLASDGIYYVLKKGEKFGKKNIINGSNIESEQLINGSLRFIKNYVDQISKGKFNLSDLQKRESEVCQYCDFDSICRIKSQFNYTTITAET